MAEKKTTKKTTKKTEKKTVFKGWEEIITNNVIRHKCPNCSAEFRGVQLKANYNRCPVCGYPAEEA